MPMRSRTWFSWSSVMPTIWASPIQISPLVGRVSPPMQCSVVVLPDPDMPMMQTISPGMTCRLTPLRICLSPT